MGVTGLLVALKDIQVNGKLERYRGKTLAIDTYGWLHRGLISCAQELCQDKPTTKYITSIMNKVQMLRDFGITPYFVFDGAALPTKADTATERRNRRIEARHKAEEYEKSNKSKLAWKEYMKAACVTSQMAKSLMVEFDNHNIKYIVAPYEADPQMVYLEKIGLVDGILSEDSDLLVFGCNRLITKLKDDGDCVEIHRDNFNKVSSIPHLAKYTPEQLRLVAMLSGCDYTKGIAGVGLKSAFKLVTKYNNLEKVLIALRAEGKPVSDDFKDEVFKADLAFQYQKVFNPLTQTLEKLNDYPEDFNIDFDTLESCCGKTYTHEHYQKVCRGFLDPNTHEILISREQNLSSLKSKSINGSSSFGSNPPNLSFRSKSAGFKPPVVPKNSIVDMLNAMKVPVKVLPPPPPPPQTPMKRASETRLSPTAKKMQKLTTPNQSSNTSKFFNSNSNIQSNDWDMSGDSEFSEVTAVSTVDKEEIAPNTDNILDELTDNDEDHIEEEVENNKSSSVDAVVDPFESSDEEIDESPIKVKPIDTTTIIKIKTSLRESFVCGSNKRFELTRTPLASKDINQLKPIQSKVTKDINLSKHVPPTKISLQTLPPLKGSVPIRKPTTSNSLKRFAFHR
ncbi:exonuclease [Scheffersomyces amazonensis]|uniref:exonuclease n=1 Tax=Scheffersomyces amazonensis TaxID=1078765 RepID=UPI00315C5AB7